MIAGEGAGFKHILIWRYEGGGPEEREARLEMAGVQGRNCRVVQLDPAAPVNNIRVIHFGRADDLASVPLKLEPWGVLWIEVE